MNTNNTFTHICRKIAVMALCVAGLGSALAGNLESIIDDFSDQDANSLGITRVFVDDSSAGGQTRTQYSVDNGVLHASGEISPPRGQPGWASTVLLFDPQGLAADASAFEGIRLLVKVNKGNLSVSANSSEVTNFDYHAAPVTRHSGTAFHEVKIPFSSMKRAWSEQTSLNTKSLTSLSLVAFDLQQGVFDFEVDEISFY